MSCTIKRSTTRRPVTLQEFIKQKGSSPFAELRQLGKGTNFLMIFGGSPRMFAQQTLEVQWTHDQVLQFIRENNLEALKERLMSSYGQREPERKVDYYTVGTFMRDNFFSLYPGLAYRIQRNRDFAAENGYVQTLFGLRRKMIIAMLKGEYDKENASRMLRNLDNIAANTDIQLFEGVVMNIAIVRISDELRERNMKSSIWNMVHDSIDMYVHKDEFDDVVEILQRHMTRSLPELSGVPLEIDIEISDLRNGEYYKGGHRIT